MDLNHGTEKASREVKTEERTGAPGRFGRGTQPAGETGRTQIRTWGWTTHAYQESVMRQKCKRRKHFGKEVCRVNKETNKTPPPQNKTKQSTEDEDREEAIECENMEVI